MLRLTPWLLAASFVGCKACVGCIDPGLPDQPDTRPGETEQPADTQESQPPEDTAPPPPCAQPEVEPNDSMTDATAILLEQIACGGFAEGGDGEWLVFPAEDASWLRVDIDAADVGSAANVAMTIVADESNEVALIYGSRFSQDPWIVFPALGDAEYSVYLRESDGGSGEDYEWELLASEDKEPLASTVSEQEPNDLAAKAMTVQAGDVVFGTISSADDYDWMHIATPAGEDKVSWSFTVEAYGSGSPLQARLTLFNDDIVGNDIADVDWIATAFTDEDAYDRDPRLEYQSEGEGDWYLLIKSPNVDGSGASGSAFHWYTVTVDNDLE